MPEETVDQEREQLADAFRSFISHGEELLRSRAGEAGEAAVATRARLEAQLREARQKLAALEGRLADRARAAAKSTDQYVHDNPWQSVGIAAGAGLIIGLLIGRR
jgi:ElaB/YqjD/DUF883 family membrane-anchored ribosome-binding protein